MGRVGAGPWQLGEGARAAACTHVPAPPSFIITFASASMVQHVTSLQWGGCAGEGAGGRAVWCDGKSPSLLAPAGPAPRRRHPAWAQPPCSALGLRLLRPPCPHLSPTQNGHPLSVPGVEPCCGGAWGTGSSPGPRGSRLQPGLQHSAAVSQGLAGDWSRVQGAGAPATADSPFTASGKCHTPRGGMWDPSLPSPSTVAAKWREVPDAPHSHPTTTSPGAGTGPGHGSGARCRGGAGLSCL